MAIDREAFRRAARAKPDFTFAQGAAALEKHGLGTLDSWEAAGANQTNGIFRAGGSGGVFFVKIKFRGTTSLTRPGASLRVEAGLTEHIRAHTDLPLPALCLYDDDTAVFGHPYLVASGLPGRMGRDYFEDESTAPEQRRDLLRQFGAVVATINGTAPPPDLPRRDLSHWREDIRVHLLENRDLLAALPAECRPRVERVAGLLEGIDLLPPPPQNGLLWGDAALHNVLVKDGEICGVYDFEDGALGPLAEDQLHVASEYRVRKPREVYGRPGNAEALWQGYAEAGGRRLEPDPTYLKIKKTLMGAGFYWFWEVLGALHPRTPEWLENLENGLRDLKET